MKKVAEEEESKVVEETKVDGEKVAEEEESKVVEETKVDGEKVAEEEESKVVEETKVDGEEAAVVATTTKETKHVTEQTQDMNQADTNLQKWVKEKEKSAT